MELIRLGRLQISSDDLEALSWCERTKKIRCVLGGRRKTISFSSPAEARTVFFAACRSLEKTHQLTERPMNRRECLRSPLYLAGAGFVLLLVSLLASVLIPSPVTEKFVSSGAAVSLSAAFWVLGGLWCVPRLVLVPQLYFLKKDPDDLS